VKTFSYKVCDHYDAVIILAAGPSINKCFDKIRKFQEDNPSNVVLACNYDFPIPSDYTVYVDSGRYRKFIKSIKSPRVIVCPTAIVKKEHMKNHEMFVFKWDHTIQPYNVDQYIVNPDGSTGHKLGNCGMACLYISHFFKPKKVLIAGFDGPERDRKTVMHFNKIKRKWTQINLDRLNPKKKCVKNKIIPLLKSKGIKVYTFDECPFWGIRECVKTI
jgi:hypothetical protein